MNATNDVLLEKGLPADVGTEKLILGAMLNGQSPSNVIGVMQISDFSLEKHRRIFGAMTDLEATGFAIDRVTVANELLRREQLESVDGLTYLSSLDEAMPSVINLDAYVSIVRDKAVLRHAVLAMQAAINECLMAADPTHEILERAERAVVALGTETCSASFRPLKEVLDRAGGLSAILNPDKSCVKTPWPLLNRTLMGGGFMPGQMIVIGARPSMGKTAMACQIADLAATAGVGVAFFTLEMPDQAILLRMAAARAQVDSLKVTQRRASDAERQALARAFDDLTDPESCRLWIDDTTGCTVPAMRRALRMLAVRHDIGLVVIDYLQLVETCSGGARNRYEQITEISRGAKRLAREFNVPIVVLAQLNRESEKEARKPRLSDLRDSGSIEQDADIVLMPSLRSGQDEQSDTLAIDLIIAKQRNGPRCLVPLTFLRRYAKLVESSQEAQVA
jgi:replicative DNA helicase